MLKVRRNVLRSHLLKTRTIAEIPPLVECCYCWKKTPLSERGFDLHEIIISRQIVRSLSDDAQLAIHDHRNCGWVHVGRCHQLAEGGTGRLLTMVNLMKYVGYEQMYEFVMSMDIHLSPGTIREMIADIVTARNLVEYAMEKLNAQR